MIIFLNIFSDHQIRIQANNLSIANTWIYLLFMTGAINQSKNDSEERIQMFESMHILLIFCFKLLIANEWSVYVCAILALAIFIVDNKWLLRLISSLYLNWNVIDFFFAQKSSKSGDMNGYKQFWFIPSKWKYELYE